MFCAIYKGRRRSDTYLYLPTREGFDAVPDELRRLLGEPVHVMDLVLTPERRLARTEAYTVMRSLLLKGCYVQLPPGDSSSTSGTI